MNIKEIMFEISADSPNMHRDDDVYYVDDGIMRGGFNIAINGYKLPKPYKCPVYINHAKITKEEVIADIVCYCIENRERYHEFDNFQTPRDYQDFADAFGFHKIEDILNLVIEFKCCNKGLKFMNLSEKEEKLVQEYEDDSEANLKKVSALIKRHFNVLFDSDYIDK